MSTHPLHAQPLPKGTILTSHESGLPERVSADSPALEVMTDLRRVKAITTVSGATLNSAHQRMIHTEVRLLLVLDRSGTVVGLISARDLMGEKPMTIAAREQISHDQLHVEHIMTPAAEIQVIPYHEIEQAKVSDVVHSLRAADRQHALVIEPMDHGGHAVRGVFSLSQIGRQLGIKLEPSGMAQSMAELERLINH